MKGTIRIRLARHPVRRILQYVLLIAGAVCLGVYCYSYLERTLYQSYESWKFDHSSPVEVTVPAGHRPAPAARKIAPLSTIGRISIPRLHLAAMVREGDGDEVLRDAVGHIPYTPLPGQSGNVGVAGHRDTFFRDLRHIERNDEIRFSTLQGDFRYRVEEMMIVMPEDVAVLRPEPQNMLTIVTCYPFSYIGNAPKRFVVRAKQVGAPSS